MPSITRNDDMPQVNAMDGFNNQQKRYDPFSNQYNPGGKTTRT
jgi:hypothetical protein